MKVNKIYPIIISLMLLSYKFVLAEDIPTRWTYSYCIEWAKKNNINLQKLNLELLQSEEDTKIAKDKWLPSFDFSTTHGYSNFPNPTASQTGNSYNSSYAINASWTIWDGNIRKYEAESAKIMEQERLLAIKSGIDNLETSIFEAYLKILYYNEVIKIAKESLKISIEQAKKASELLKDGKISEKEYADIETQRAEDVYSVVSAEGQYAMAKNSLKKILELRINDGFEICDIEFNDDIILSPLPDKINVYDYACSWNPLIKSNDINAQLLSNDIKIAKAGYLPKINLSAGIGTGYTTIDKGNWGQQIGHSVNENIGLTFSIPIFDGNQTKRAITKAKLAAIDYELTNEDLRNQLSQTIEQLYIDCRNAQAKYISGIKHVEIAQLTVNLVDAEFYNGTAKSIEMLEAHDDLNDARLELLQNKYTAILCVKMINYYISQTIELP